MLRKCRACGLEAKTKSDLTKFATDKTLPHGRKNFCRECHSKDSMERCKTNKQTNKIKTKEYLGGSFTCKKCGFTHDYIGIFDWHHKDPITKEIGVSRILHYSWEKVKKEIDKCEFLCANCHRLAHIDQSLY